MAQRVRCFVAVEIEDGIREQLAETQKALRAAGGQVRWSPPQNLHVTLKFLGEIDESSVGDACTIVERVAAEHEGFTAQFAGLGAFPNLRRPRIVFAEVHDESGTLASLARALDQSMTAIGVQREGKPFRSHLTLGRVKSSRGMADLTRAVETHVEQSFGTQAVHEIVLMRSELLPSGAVYSPLGVGKLGELAAS